MPRLMLNSREFEGRILERVTKVVRDILVDSDVIDGE